MKRVVLTIVICSALLAGCCADKSQSKWRIMIIKRKDFEKIFSELATENKKIWAIAKIKELHKDVIDIAVRLYELDFINFVKITNETIAASSEIKGTTNKKPISRMHHPTATGVEIIYHVGYKILDFFEINSSIKGNGSKMISAILTNLPYEWKLHVTMDWSGGFWKKMKEKYSDREWII